MQIDVNGPDGNIFAILGYARRILRAVGDRRGADGLAHDVMAAESFHDACFAVHKATHGAITFWDDGEQLEFEEGA